MNGKEKFEAFYCAYRSLIRWKLASYVKPGELDDAEQEVWGYVLKRFDQIRCFEVYISFAIRHIAKKIHKHREYFETISSIDEETVYGESCFNNPERTLIEKELSAIVKTRVEALPVAQRISIQDCDLDGESFKESAEKQNISLSAVSQNHARGLRNLREDDRLQVLRTMFLIIISIFTRNKKVEGHIAQATTPTKNTFFSKSIKKILSKRSSFLEPFFAGVLLGLSAIGPSVALYLLPDLLFLKEEFRTPTAIAAGKKVPHHATPSPPTSKTGKSSSELLDLSLTVAPTPKALHYTAPSPPAPKASRRVAPPPSAKKYISPPKQGKSKKTGTSSASDVLVGTCDNEDNNIHCDNE